MRNAREPIRYVLVGGLVFSADVFLFNLFSFSSLNIEPVTSKIASGICATLLAFYLHRHWTFGDRSYEYVKMKQATLFFVVQAVGILIATMCLWFSHYILGLRNPVADNIAGNVVGLVLATAFRYFFNSRYVYR
jgi:putative flippase GtrA